MIISLLLIGASYYSAPFGALLLTAAFIREFVKADRKCITFIKLIRESTFLLPGIILVLSATIGPLLYGNWFSAGLGLLILAPIVFCATSIEIFWKPEDSLHFARYATMLLFPVCFIAFAFPWSGSFFVKSSIAIRLMGTFTNPNYFSYALEIILLFAFALFYHMWKKSSRNWLILSTALGLTCLYLTGSRSGMLAFLAGLTVFFLSMSEKNVLVIVFGFIMIVLTATAIFPELSVLVFSDIIPRPQTFLKDFENRFALWDVAIRQIVKNPLWATGINSYHLYMPADAPSNIRSAIHSHNIYVNFLLETGLLGFISFLWIIIKSIIISVKALHMSSVRPYLAAGIAMIAATLVHGIMDAPLVSSQGIILFGLFLGALSVMVRQSRQKVKTKQKILDNLDIDNSQHEN
jgi:O-antigen ligase